MYGVSEGDIAAMQEKEAALAQAARAGFEEFAVYTDCWDSVMFFDDRVSRLWVREARMVPMGMGMGVRQTCVHLDWCQVQAVMNMLAVPKRKRAVLLDDLQLMEAAALMAWDELAGRAAQ